MFLFLCFFIVAILLLLFVGDAVSLLWLLLTCQLYQHTCGLMSLSLLLLLMLLLCFCLSVVVVVVVVVDIPF